MLDTLVTIALAKDLTAASKLLDLGRRTLPGTALVAAELRSESLWLVRRGGTLKCESALAVARTYWLIESPQERGRERAGDL